MKGGFTDTYTHRMHDLEKLKSDANKELSNILDFWMQHTIDNNNGGFIGRIDHENKVYPEAPRGSVMYSRILWAFSAAYNNTGKEEYKQIAVRAYEYISQNLMDKEYGGIY